MTRLRTFVLGIFAAMVMSQAAVAVPIWLPAVDGGVLIRQLMNRTSLLLSEIETTRAGGFIIPVTYVDSRPQVIPAIVPVNSWGVGYANMLFAQPIPPPPVAAAVLPFGVVGNPTPITLRTMDYYLSIPVNTFKIEAANLYERYADWFMGTNRALRELGTGIFLQPANVADQWAVTVRAEMNAIDAAYFYIVAARNTYLIPRPYLHTCQCPGARPCAAGDGARAFLMNQLIIIERLTQEVAYLMAQIRYSLPYPLPFPPGCIDLALVPGSGVPPVAGLPLPRGPIAATPYPVLPYFRTIVPPRPEGGFPVAPMAGNAFPGMVPASNLLPNGQPQMYQPYPNQMPALPAAPGGVPGWQLPQGGPGIGAPLAQGQVPQMGVIPQGQPNAGQPMMYPQGNPQQGQPVPPSGLLQGPPPPPPSQELTQPFGNGQQRVPPGVPTSNF